MNTFSEGGYLRRTKYHHRTRLVWFIALASLIALPLALPAPAEATVIRAMDMDDLVQASDDIVVAKVEKQTSFWDETHQYIVTEMSLRVAESLWGNASGVVTVRRLGGVVDGIGMKVAGVTILDDRDEAVMFLRKNGEHRYVVGMKQGAFHITRDNNGIARVERNLSGMTLIQPSAASKSSSTLSNSQPRRVSQPETLEDFLKTVRELVQQRKTRKIKR